MHRPRTTPPEFPQPQRGPGGQNLRGLVFSILEFAKSGRFSWTWSSKLKKYDIFWLLFLTMAHFLILNALKAFFDLDLLEQI